MQALVAIKWLPIYVTEKIGNMSEKEQGGKLETNISMGKSELTQRGYIEIIMKYIRNSWQISDPFHF